MIKVQGITKQYRSFPAEQGIKDISFSVAQGEIICVLGASGSGKSTLLRCLAGLESLDSGLVVVEDKKSLSYVSQQYTLWPHLTVLENLTLVPIIQNQATVELAEFEARRLLERFGLSQYERSYSRELSGGQRQRVALLRAVMVRPDVLLLDEVTSALDPELTKSVLDLVRALAKDGYTMIVVTHHLSFAMSVANRVLFLKNGKLAQDSNVFSFFAMQDDPELRSFIADIAKKDDLVELFKGVEQYQAYHLQLIKRLPENSTIYVVGAVGDIWFELMGEFYRQYEEIRHRKNIIWKMVSYDQGEIDKRLAKEHPELNQFRKMPRNLQNPANYNVFGDTVITQIFDKQPTIIQMKNQNIADAYLRFFEEL